MPAKESSKKPRTKRSVAERARKKPKGKLENIEEASAGRVEAKNELTDNNINKSDAPDAYWPIRRVAGRLSFRHRNHELEGCVRAGKRGNFEVFQAGSTSRIDHFDLANLPDAFRVNHPDSPIGSQPGNHFRDLL